MPKSSENTSIQTAIAWCLAWGTETEPRYPIETFNSWRNTLSKGETPTDPGWQRALDEATALTELSAPDAHHQLEDLTTFIQQHPTLWQSPIGLVYGGVTKVKSYVFESADLQEIRGASALLDRINLIDLPAFFHAENSTHLNDPERFRLCQDAPRYCKHVRDTTFSDNPSIAAALIPELVVYATGGKILAFCPPAFTSQLCNAIEKRYTSETLTANSCAVGAAFRPLEIYLGLLKNPIEETLWHDAIAAQHKSNTALQSYFGFNAKTSTKGIQEAFEKRKNFNELVGKLTSQFNQRRSGDDDASTSINSLPEQPIRPSRRYPPMLETHPYLMRDGSYIRAAVATAKRLPDDPVFSEPTARKKRVGQIAKRDSSSAGWYKKWCQDGGISEVWEPEGKDCEKGIVFQSWVSKFEAFLNQTQRVSHYDAANQLFNGQGSIKAECQKSREARSLHEIGASSNGYVGYIYADGNSMGQYIRDQIKTPAQYQKFSTDIFDATAESVYSAIADHITPYEFKPDAKSSRENKGKVWIHPFEIVTIGGDDVLLIVPANKAMAVAQSIGQYFEQILIAKGGYDIPTHKASIDQAKLHRYKPASAPLSKCCLSTSSGVLITAENTPIYYADKLVSQLLKSAKQHLKTLKPNGYHGGTVDFLVLKAVTMISSNIAAFRQDGLTIPPPPPDPHRSSDLPPQRAYTIKLYAAPYTLYELGGLINTVKAIKQSGFPKSQLYQIRSLLERGKRTAILNYRYFRVRLAPDKRTFLENQFEQGWCNAGTNGGNIAPWLTVHKQNDTGNSQSNKKGKAKPNSKKKTVYETIWREMVELEPFITENSADTIHRSIESAMPASPQTQQSSQRRSP